MSKPTKKRPAANAFSTAASLALMMAVVTAVSTPTPELRAFVTAAAPAAAPFLHPLAAFAMVGLSFTLGALAMGISSGWPAMLRMALLGVAGFAVGSALARTFDAFGAVQGRFAAAGLYEIAAFIVGGLFMLVGVLAWLAVAVKSTSEAQGAFSRRDRAMTAPAAAVWVLEGAAVVLLTALHLRAGAPLDQAGLIMFGLLCLVLLLDVAFHALTWRAMDEFMRAAWGEAMGLSLVIAMTVGFVYAGAMSLGLVPEVGLYHAFTAFLGLYLVVALIHAAVRMPEVFAAHAPERAA